MCVHCCDHGDNIVVHPSLDLEVVLIIDPIQGVEALIKDILYSFGGQPFLALALPQISPLLLKEPWTK